MPELPEVETVVRGVRPKVVDCRVTECRLASPLLAETDGGDFASRITGRTILALDRQGKWMFFRLDAVDTLVIHLGMTGRLSVEPSKTPLANHTHLRLALDDGKRELRLSDPRRFGELLLFGRESMESRFGPDKLGPDAMKITLAQLSTALRGTKRVVKSVLLDQRVLAGVGNIYADEILFASGIHPRRRTNTLRTEEIALIHAATAKVLRRAVRHGGSTIRDYVDSRGVPGEFQKLLSVYGRSGAPCGQCGVEIRLCRKTVSGRATHYCPECQPLRRRRLVHLAQ